MTATEIRARIAKLSAMTEARGASANEAATARKAISRLQAMLPQDDVKLRAPTDTAFTDNFVFTAARSHGNWFRNDEIQVAPLADDFLNAIRNWTRTGTMRTRRHRHG